MDARAHGVPTATWGSYTIIFSFVNKWLGADGRDFVIVHTKDDRWATIEGRFMLAAEKPRWEIVFTKLWEGLYAPTDQERESVGA